MIHQIILGKRMAKSFSWWKLQPGKIHENHVDSRRAGKNQNETFILKSRFFSEGFSRRAWTSNHSEPDEGNHAATACLTGCPTTVRYTSSASSKEFQDEPGNKRRNSLFLMCTPSQWEFWGKRYTLPSLSQFLSCFCGYFILEFGKSLLYPVAILSTVPLCVKHFLLDPWWLLTYLLETELSNGQERALTSYSARI